LAKIAGSAKENAEPELMIKQSTSVEVRVLLTNAKNSVVASEPEYQLLINLDQDPGPD
jgi:hypothetical protein